MLAHDSELLLLNVRDISYYPLLCLSAALPPVSRYANRARMEPLVCLTEGDREPDA